MSSCVDASRQGRRHRRAATSTASSCSSASPTAATRSACRRNRPRIAKVQQALNAAAEVSGEAPVVRWARSASCRPRRSPRQSWLKSRLARLCADFARLRRSRIIQHAARPAAYRANCRHVPSRTARDLAGAVEKTRTSTAFRPQRPQRCASTSSATTALVKMRRNERAAPGKARPLAKRPWPAQCREIRLHNGTMVNSAIYHSRAASVMAPWPHSSLRLARRRQLGGRSRRRRTCRPRR